MIYVLLDATDMPSDVMDYCVDHEIQTHYQNDVASLQDDGNPFSEWIKKVYGVRFKLNEQFLYVAIIST